MKLEDLVPPLELCKQIPQGEFADSAFVWCGKYNFEVVLRKDNQVIPISWSKIPAPMLPELLLACPLDTVAGTEHHGDFWIRYGVGDKQILIERYNSAESALLLWLKVNGLERKDNK